MVNTAARGRNIFLFYVAAVSLVDNAKVQREQSMKYFLLTICVFSPFLHSADLNISIPDDKLNEQVREIERAITAQKKERDAYIRQSKQEFMQWRRKQKKDFDRFNAEIQRIWGYSLRQNPACWTEFNAQKDTYTSIDYKKNELSAAVVVKPGDSLGYVQQKLINVVSRFLLSGGTASSIPVYVEPHLQISSEPILTESIIPRGSKKEQKEAAEGVAKDLILTGQRSEVSLPDKRKIVSLAAPLECSLLESRLSALYPFITVSAARFGVSVERILATIHVESHFNPMARSHAGAIGLMQIVPWSGGREGILSAEGRDGIPTEASLFNPETNIRIGTAYISRLNRHYFADITRPLSRTYCSIAAYNTGPGNVMRACIGSNDLVSGISWVNAVESAAALYTHLITHLPYAETRAYVPKVYAKMHVYARYGSGEVTGGLTKSGIVD